MSTNRAHLTSIVTLVILAAAATAFAGFADTEVYLPAVGAAPGVPPAVWYTTVWVHNPSTTRADVTFALLERRANPAPLTYTDSIPPGDTRRYDNAVETMFGLQTFGAIRVTANVAVVVGSRIYSQPGAALEDSSGQFFAAVPASFAIGAGESTEIVGGWQTRPTADSAFRFNYGLVETTGAATCQVEVVAKDESGATLATKSYTLGPWEQLQKAFANEFPALSSDNVRLTVKVTGGKGRVIAFGSSVSNGLDDPSTLEMRFADELLAANSGGGTVTGVNAGGGLTGGGTTGNLTLDVGAGPGIAVGANAVSIADGGVTTAMVQDAAVTAAKLSPVGGSGGQVLKHNGSTVTWGDDQQGGLSLPYSASVAAPGFAAFHVVNTGGFQSTALKGEATGQGTGVIGVSESGHGVRAVTSATNDYAFAGENLSNGSWGYIAGHSGVNAFSDTGDGMTGGASAGNAAGVRGSFHPGGNFGMLGTADQGVYGENATTHAKGSFGSSDYGVYGRQYGGTHAGYSNGDVQVNGTLSKWGGSFKIDHPLDPANKYLSHSFVESPDMMNIYNGNVVTDADGRATVELPEWFEALNRDFRYQLTVIGEFAQAVVSKKVDGNRFEIRTSRPKVEVSWQVTGIRRDAWAEPNRIQVEEDKPEAERGTYLAPDAWGQPEERGLEWLQEEAGIRSDREPADTRETPAESR